MQNRTDQWDCKILGIDPGSQNAGYALIQAKEKSFKILDSGVCQLDGKTDFFQRLSQLQVFFAELSGRCGDYHLAVESLAFVKNANSFGKLAQARGVIIAALAGNASATYEYPPNLVKSIVAGYGHASKRAVEKSIALAGQNREFQTHDESDALAVAMCHHFQRGRVPQGSVKRRGSSTLKSVFKGRNL